MSTLNKAKEIRFNGEDVILARLNDKTVYSFNDACAIYTLSNTNIESYDIIQFSLPFFGIKEGNTITYSADNYNMEFYKKLQITLLDGSVIDGTDDLSKITCDMVKEIKAYYQDGIAGLKFKYSGASYDPKIETMKYVNLTNLEQLSFEYCYDMEAIPSSIIMDTSSLTTMKLMFRDCSSLASLDASNWNTHNVTNMESMFNGCSNLTSLDVSSWDTSNVINMGYMFYECSGLTSLDLSSFNTSNVINMSNMFNLMYMLVGGQPRPQLGYLDLSNFDMSNVTSTSKMFNNCVYLHTLRLDNCSNNTINKIITSTSFPTNTIEGVTRKIYCKEENIFNQNGERLKEPTNWVFIDCETNEVIE